VPAVLRNLRRVAGLEVGRHTGLVDHCEVLCQQPQPVPVAPMLRARGQKTQIEVRITSWMSLVKHLDPGQHARGVFAEHLDDGGFQGCFQLVRGLRLGGDPHRRRGVCPLSHTQRRHMAPRRTSQNHLSLLSPQGQIRESAAPGWIVLKAPTRIESTSFESCGDGTCGPRPSIPVIRSTPPGRPARSEILHQSPKTVPG
jgi:hypothetical protein